MEQVSAFFGQDRESQIKAAEAKVVLKKQELQTAETELATLLGPVSGTVTATGGRRRKSKKRSTRRSRK